ncbi:MAG: ABC-2 family transporter protein [Planctomycetales bacterium]|nr:ABC-2 family transporter protein [Planctomycetales bacterium]
MADNNQIGQTKIGPNYLRVFLTFARNSLVRDMMFRTNFLIESVSSLAWSSMNVGLYLIIFQYATSIGDATGWGKYEFFVFMGTTWIINAIVQAFFMPNIEEFSDLIRTGGLDFAMLKPIDTQFLISLRKVSWSSLANLLLGSVLIGFSISQLATRQGTPWSLPPSVFLLFPMYVLCGVAILYSLMICLAATSVWLGRNQTLYDFWFYITNFSRYPMEIYARGWGIPLFVAFTFLIPVLVVVNVPARLLAQPLAPKANWEWPLALFTLFATVLSVLASRWVFRKALLSYRSASS